MIRLLLISLFLISSIEKYTELTKEKAKNYITKVEQTGNDTLLAGIQSKIYNAFVRSLISQDNTPLNQISKELENSNKTKKQNITQYWQAYLQFYSSIYYLKKGDNKTAEKEIDKGIVYLEKIKHKNSEDYALLAMIQGFSIQFKETEAVFISEKIKKNAKTAIALDSTNLRAYYVYANNDFYSSGKYGNENECEKYLLKAISLPSQKTKNKHLPSWGKEESYNLLVQFYMHKEKWDLAQKYLKKGIKEFPGSYTLNQLATKLAGKQ